MFNTIVPPLQNHTLLSSKSNRVRFCNGLSLVFAVTLALSLCVYTTMAPAQQAVVNGLVSYWTFDAADIAGDTVADVFGDNDGTITGAPKSVAGKVGEGLEFDGTKDYVEYDVFDLSGQGTIEAYIKPAAFGTILTILALASETCNTCYCHFRVFRNAKLEVTQCNNDQWDWLTGSTTLSENTWYHVAVVSNGTSYKLYVDGKEEGLTVTGGANSGDWFDDTDKRDNITIGVFKRAALDDFFHGIIDEVRLYKRALSANEIKQNMNAEGLAVSTSKKLTLTWGEIKISR